MAKKPSKTSAAGKARKPGADSPSRDTRYKPGQSGNPNGRPRKERSLLAHIEDELDAEVQVTEGGRSSRLTRRQVLAKTMVHNALKGDHKALIALLRILPPPKSEGEDDQATVPLETVVNFLMRKGALGAGETGDE